MRRRLLKRWMALPGRPGRTADEVRTELENHLAESIHYLVQHGMTPDAARAEAMRRLGSLDDVHRTLYRLAQRREAVLTMREHLASLRDDLRYTARSLARRPGFSALVM